MGIWGESMHVESSLQYLREMDQDKQSSKRGFGALSKPEQTFCGWVQQLDRSGPAPG